MKYHWSRRILPYVLILLVIDIGGTRVLNGLHIVDLLLASKVPMELGVLPLAVFFLTAHLLVLFLAPGLLAAALLLGWLWPPRR